MNEVTNKFNVDIFVSNQRMIRQNTSGQYKNTFGEKSEIMGLLDEKFNTAMSLPGTTAANKNLVYYSIFGVDYVMLLELSLSTIIKNTPIPNFDVLIITDTTTEKLLKSLVILSKFNVDIMIVPTPVDGVAASVIKLNFGKYEKLSEYKKVLFLDGDILCDKDINFLFDSPANNKLEVVVSPLVERTATMTGLILAGTITHGLGFFRDNEKEFVLTNSPKIFNAGQFLFDNTAQMRCHIDNVMWLQEKWPAAYYFEQSAINHYFNLRSLSSYGILNDNLTIFKNVSNIRGIRVETFIENPQHDPKHSLFHFAGTPTDGRNKYQFMTHYCKRHSICL